MIVNNKQANKARNLYTNDVISNISSSESDFEIPELYFIYIPSLGYNLAARSAVLGVKHSFPPRCRWNSFVCIAISFSVINVRVPIAFPFMTKCSRSDNGKLAHTQFGWVLRDIELPFLLSHDKNSIRTRFGCRRAAEKKRTMGYFPQPSSLSRRYLFSITSLQRCLLMQQNFSELVLGL